jgi:hypothetical protein
VKEGPPGDRAWVSSCRSTLRSPPCCCQLGVRHCAYTPSLAPPPLQAGAVWHPPRVVLGWRASQARQWKRGNGSLPLRTHAAQLPPPACTCSTAPPPPPPAWLDGAVLLELGGSATTPTRPCTGRASLAGTARIGQETRWRLRRTLSDEPVGAVGGTHGAADTWHRHVQWWSPHLRLHRRDLLRTPPRNHHPSRCSPASTASTSPSRWCLHWAPLVSFKPWLPGWAPRWLPFRTGLGPYCRLLSVPTAGYCPSGTM